MQPTSPRARLLLCWAAALLCSLPSIALAQPAPDPRVTEADDKFVAGREAVKKSDFVRAVELFRRSQELVPSVGTLLNIANAEEQLGQLVAALAHYQAALKQLPEADERISVAREGVARLTPRVPSLRVERIAGAPETTRIVLAGQPMLASAVGVEQPMNPGAYTVVVTAPDHEPRRYEVKLVEGMRATLAVEPGKEILAPPPPPPRAGAAPMVGFSFIGLGVAGLGMGVVTGVLAVVKKGQLDTTCPSPAKCSADGLRIEASGKTLAALSTASLLIGAVGVGAGLTIVVVTRERRAPAAALGVAPLPGGGFLGVHGAF